MAMLKKIGRLFTIKTRLEAWLVIYAIALGAVERGRLYLDTYPGWGGWLLAVACTGVVFIAGGSCSIRCKPADAGDCRRALRGAGRGAASSLVVVDPRSGRIVAVQQSRDFTSHRLTPAQVTGPEPPDMWRGYRTRNPDR